MPTSTAYSQVNVTVAVDQRQVIGLWDGDDAIVVTRGADLGTMMIGADGSGLFSISADKSAQISIKVQHTSPTHRLLIEKEKQQYARGAAFPGFPFSLKDTVSGEGGTADKCYIMQAPADSKGKAAAVREWVLITADWNPEVPNG